MGNRLYVSNLSFSVSETELMDLFAQAGAVKDVALIQDRTTGRSRGFAFVTMATDEEAANAISQFHGKTWEGRALNVNEARPREPRMSVGGGGGGGGTPSSGSDWRSGTGPSSGGGGGGGGFRDRGGRDRGGPRGGGGGRESRGRRRDDFGTDFEP